MATSTPIRGGGLVGDAGEQRHSRGVREGYKVVKQVSPENAADLCPSGAKASRISRHRFSFFKLICFPSSPTGGGTLPACWPTLIFGFTYQSTTSEVNEAAVILLQFQRKTQLCAQKNRCSWSRAFLSIIPWLLGEMRLLMDTFFCITYSKLSPTQQLWITLLNYQRIPHPLIEWRTESLDYITKLPLL